MSLCITAGAQIVALAIEAFSLSWTHSVEKIEWRENWRIDDARLVLRSASVEGSGAGMEVPDGAVLKDGAWHYRPTLAPLRELHLRDAGLGNDWTLCSAKGCRRLGDIVSSPSGLITLAPCTKSQE